MPQTIDLYSFITEAVRQLPLAIETDELDGSDLGLDAFVAATAARDRKSGTTRSLAAAFRNPTLQACRADDLTQTQIAELIADGQDPFADADTAAATCLAPDHTHRLALLARVSACLVTPDARAALTAPAGILLIQETDDVTRDRAVSLLKAHLLPQLIAADPNLSGLDPEAVYQTEEPFSARHSRHVPARALRGLANGGACALVGDIDHLPEADRMFVRARMDLPPLDADLVVAILRGSHSRTGGLAENEIRSRMPPNADLARLPDLGLAASFGSGSTLGVADRLREFAGLLDRQTKLRTTLDDLPGLPAETLAPIRAVIADVAGWRAGAADWSDIPASFLLHGPPGTGKTALARAVAAEMGVPLVATSYAEWQAAGAGHLGTFLAALIQSFDAAAAQTPCVLFVDELDSFPVRRNGSDPGSTYNAKVVNGLLAQLNRLSNMEGVVLVCATNHPDRIDPAIRRSGRIDTHIHVSRPDRAGLAAILRHYLRDTPIPDTVIDSLSGRFLGQTGADIEALVRRARSNARQSREDLSGTHLLNAADRLGPTEDPAYLCRVATHEAGHAIVGRVLGLPPREIVVSMETSYTLGPELRILTPDLARRRLTVMLAGRAAEKLVYETPSDGAGGSDTSDLARATCLAAKMHLQLGFGGTLVRAPDSGIANVHTLPPAVRRKIENELRGAERKATAILEARLDELGRLADRLVAERQIDLEVCPEPTVKTSGSRVGEIDMTLGAP